jgi:A nuclease family of the HNH/ENDO VII superfamily with conserved AHH
MSDKQHRLDHKKLGDKNWCCLDSTEGGRCLNRHQGRAENSCSHQWQGFKRAKADPSPYNWPKYQGMGAGTQVFFQGKTRYVAAPGQGDWDVTAGNFDTSCNVPYFHEAHHIVPNSTLAKAIEGAVVTQAHVYRVRGGLLDAGYNLNYKKNMILLPLDKAVAARLELPRHRRIDKFSHTTYSNYVEEWLTKQLLQIAQALDLDAHADPDLKSFKEFLDQVQMHLYAHILIAGEEVEITMLDEMSEEWFDPDPDEDVDMDE